MNRYSATPHNVLAWIKDHDYKSLDDIVADLKEFGLSEEQISNAIKAYIESST